MPLLHVVGGRAELDDRQRRGILIHARRTAYGATCTFQLQNKEQMDKPAVQQLQVVVNALKQKIQEFNAKQLVLRSSAKSMDTNRAWTLPKIS